MILLTDTALFLYPSFGTSLYSLNAGSIFVYISVGDDGPSTKEKNNPQTLRHGPLTLTQVSGGLGWAAKEWYEVPQGVRSLRVTAWVHDPDRGKSLIGRIELHTNNLQDISVQADNSFLRALAIDTGFFIASSCIYIPRDQEQPSNGLSIHENYRLALEDHKNGYDRCWKIGDYFHSQFSHFRKRADLEEAVSYYEVGARLTPESAKKPSWLDRLGRALLLRYDFTKELRDIDQAISHREHAVGLTRDGYADRPGHLNKLASSFMRRFEHSGNPRDIDKAILHREHAVHLMPDGHAGKPARLDDLGISYANRFEHSGNLGDIDKAISHREHAVHLTPDGHAGKPARLDDLGISYANRFEHSGDLGDVDKAISYHEKAVHLTPDGHADKPAYLNNLGHSFSTRSGHSGDLMDIDKAILYCERAMHLTPDGHASQPAYLTNLGNSLSRHFEHSGDLRDIDKAISYHENAVDLTPDNHADKPTLLTNLGNSLARHFIHSGDLMEIDKAISYHEHAVHLTPDGHPAKPARLSNLGNSLSRRFEQSGDLKDIDKAVSHHNSAMCLTTDTHSAKAGHLNNLGLSLSRRFEHSGDLIDIENAISHHESAVSLTSNSHAGKPALLINLGTSYLRHFEHSGDPMYLDKAISHHEHAVNLTPDGYADKPGHLNNLGNSLSQRFKYSGDPGDINKAVFYHENAVQLTPEGHADNKPVRLNNLGNSLSSRFERSKDLGDIDMATSHHEHAIHLTPDGHVKKPGLLANLGNTFLRRSEHTSLEADLQKSILAYKRSAMSSVGKPSTLFQAALQWARLSYDIDLSASLSGYETVMSLLPRVAWLGHSISVRYGRLASFGNIVTEAASTAIALGRPNTALEWLEQGRSVVWNQLLNLRTPFDDLREVNSSLADDLVSVSQALDNANTSELTPDRSGTLEQAAQAHRRLAEKWDNLLSSVRMLSGFEDFLLPKKLSALTKAAESGPVAVINVHKSRSDALILLSGFDDVVHIPLKSSLYKKAQDLQGLLNGELRAAGIGIRNIRAGRPAPPNSSGHIFADILADLWTWVVKPVLDGIAYNHMDSSDSPRIWWCPTGPLTFLPIHAAGLYNQSPPGPNLADFAISSYTPTVTALLKTSQHISEGFNGLLGVSQSNTPGLGRLPNADKELDLIKQFGSRLHIQSLQDKLATVERVFEGMEGMSWVHFACHAIQDPSSPLQSAFCLENGPLTLSKIITKSFPNADFAFLSACETATGDKSLPEESVHLAAGMLAAGYKSVIATMWPIGDEDAPLIAKEVYSRLLARPGKPDSSEAAQALHHAVKQLREKLGTKSGSRAFLSWVPFIHVGK